MKSNRSLLLLVLVLSFQVIVTWCIWKQRPSTWTSQKHPSYPKSDTEIKPSEEQRIRILTGSESGVLLGKLAGEFNTQRIKNGFEEVNFVTTKKGNDRIILKGLGLDNVFNEWDVVFFWSNEIE